MPRREERCWLFPGGQQAAVGLREVSRTLLAEQQSLPQVVSSTRLVSQTLQAARAVLAALSAQTECHRQTALRANRYQRPLEATSLSTPECQSQRCSRVGQGS